VIEPKNRLVAKESSAMQNKMLVLVAVICFSIVDPYGCSEQGNHSGEMSKKEATRPQEEAAIAKSISDSAKALTEFPRTRDRKALEKFYAKDFVEIHDGKFNTPEENEMLLSELEEQLNLGRPIGILNQVTNIRVRVNDKIGWATYDYTSKLGIGGAVVNSEKGKCTSIHRKESTGWVIVHEHCSS